MIKADKSKVEIKGTEKELILRALNVIDNKNKNIKNEEIKNKIKEVFPNGLSDILCSLI